MGREDWYRRTSWTTKDQQEFRSRLARSRDAFNKAQYLRIQAYYLQQTGGQYMLEAALGLLEELLAKYPDELSLGTAYMQKAECLEGLGREGEALDAYRASLAVQRAHPMVRDNAYLEFAELVVRLRKKELYPEVLSVLNEFGGMEYFPSQEYQYNVSRAFALHELGNRSEASEAARLALEASGKTESGFRYHRKLGLVSEVLAEVQERLRAIAAGA